MAKSSNPLDDYKRKQRKKEKQKNKTKRITERDTKVAQTTSLSSAQSEIQNLTQKQEHQNGHLDNKDTRKLERLRKELKIVIAAEEERKKQREELERIEWEEKKKRMKTKEGVDELNQSKFRNAKASIYYDPVMNPFGAPPPGRPMMYHRRGGGKTMDANEAFVPYELRDESDDKSVDLGIEEKMKDDGNGNDQAMDEREKQVGVGVELEALRLQQPPPPPPPPPRPQHFHRNDHQPPRDYSQYAPPQHLPKVPPPRAPPPPPPLPSSKPPPKQTGPPSLPEPSDSVKRLQRQQTKNKKSKKADLMADIWASQDEINYEGGTLEGAMENIENGRLQSSSSKQRFQKKRKVEREDVYDPLCPADKGYSEYRSKDQIQRSTISQKKAKVEEDGVDSSSLEESKEKVMCQWYYVDQSRVVQGPFQSEQMNGWGQAGFFPNDTMVRNGEDGVFVEMGMVDLSTGTLKHVEEPADDGIKARIAMLKQSIQERPVERVEDRIAALKQSMAERPVESVEDRIAALKQTMQERPPESIEDRIAALKNENAHAQPYDGQEAKVELAPVAEGFDNNPSNGYIEEAPSYAAEDAPTYPLMDGEEPPSYPLNDDHEVPAYPVDENNEVPAYPVDENDEPAAYPVDENDEVPAYPVDENNEPAAYPVDENDDVPAYPVDENDEVPAYPVDENDDVPANPVDENDEVPAYPVDENDEVPAYPVDEEDVPYPTDVAYPIDGEYAYPNTDDAYNAAGGKEVTPYYIPDTEEGEQMGTPKKKAIFKGDKEVVGLVPANLQVRRNIKAKPKKNRKISSSKPNKEAQPTTEVNDGEEHSSSKAVADDYEKFMSEINTF